jgi:nicotinate phosphoribosyltransferase
VIVNFAERAHNHNWKLDPVTRSLLDTDFYKLLMLQFIWKHFPRTQASFELINRTSSVRLADIIPREELIGQLEHARSLGFRKSELIWLAGNSFYGRKGIFEPSFLDWLENDFQLSEYQLSIEDGQFRLEFDGPWTSTTLWEIYALAILDELKTRAGLRAMNEVELDMFYARAKTKLWEKISRLRGVPGLKVADFGTRRRHSFLWQEYAINLSRTVLGPSFSGTSNTYMAYKHDMEAIGTNAHEIPMALAAMAPDDDELKQSQYRVLELWQRTYQGELLIMLPDTFGTTQFLAGAPDWAADWTGQRMDSKDPFLAGDEYIDWIQKRGRDPRSKLLIASDALDVDIILGLHAYFSGEILGGARPEDFHSAADFVDAGKWRPNRRIRFSSGWGTLLTNDFRGCDPGGGGQFDPISLVCKLTSADGRPAVKLSDNYAKATGLPSEIERYRRVFGTAGVANAPEDYDRGPVSAYGAAAVGATT